MLFDPDLISGKDPKPACEPTFDYLQRSERLPFVRIRGILEQWFARFPSSNDWVSRFRNSDERTHQAAFFELYCHEFLCRHGFTVEAHPQVPDQCEGVPDFLVRCDGRSVFYMEAVTYSGEDDEVAGSRRLDRLREAINALDIRNFFVCLSTRKVGTQSIRHRRVCDWLETHSARLDPNKPNVALERFAFEESDWAFEFSFIPRNPETRGSASRQTLGLESPGARWVHIGEGLGQRLRKKAARYRNLDLPLVIAANCLDELTDEEELDVSLFGRGFGFGQFPTAEDVAVTSGPALWYSGRRFRAKHVAAAILFKTLCPWTIHVAEPRAWVNQLNSLQFQLGWRVPIRSLDLAARSIVVQHGERIRDVLQVPADLLVG